MLHLVYPGRELVLKQSMAKATLNRLLAPTAPQLHALQQLRLLGVLTTNCNALTNALDELELRSQSNA
jgi:hypothetical protein